MVYSALGKNPTVISHNVRGLNTPQKHTQLLRHLGKRRPAFVLFQETHFKANSIPKLTDRYFTKAYHAANTESKTKGVSTLIGKDSGFELLQQLADPGGWFLLLKGTIGKRPVMLANVYFLNTAHVTFCQKLIDVLTEFASGCIILGGDFNVPLDPLQDISNGKSSITYRVLKKIRVLLNKLTLKDTWRIAHPQGRDFTYFSTIHNKYSRIDFVTKRPEYSDGGTHRNKDNIRPCHALPNTTTPKHP